MSIEDAYDDSARERVVAEPPKRVEAPVRLAFERDRARVVQVARNLARAIGTNPDIAETAALAHDLGHPPFGHNGERVLAELSADCGGFEGNAQTFRLLTRLEAKTFGPGGP